MPEAVQRVVQHRLLDEQEREAECRDESEADGRLQRRQFRTGPFDSTVDAVVSSRHLKLQLYNIK